MTETISVFDGIFNSFFSTTSTEVNSQEPDVIPVPPHIANEPEMASPDSLPPTEELIREPTEEEPQNFASPTIIQEPIIKGIPFDINIYSEELKERNVLKNKSYNEHNTNMSAYDVAVNCIGSTVMKILNYPVKDWSNKWLPVVVRSTIGQAIHDVIQDNSSQFTEQEASMKVPSINFSGRLDCMNGNNCLIEIKSCPYGDYKKIIKNHQARIGDFYQLVVYKYILENHLTECQNQPRNTLRSDPPKQSNYNIDTFQFIYVAHDINSSDVDSISQAIKEITATKKLLNSKYNKFFFMTSLVMDLTTLDMAIYTDQIVEKINAINECIRHKKLPDADNKFIDTKKCFFCLYNSPGNCPYK